jgi:hypothetical protein
MVWRRKEEWSSRRRGVEEQTVEGRDGSGGGGEEWIRGGRYCRHSHSSCLPCGLLSRWLFQSQPPVHAILALLHRSVTSLSRPLSAAGGDNTEKGAHEELELRRRLQHLVASTSLTVIEQRRHTHEELDPRWCVLH